MILAPSEEARSARERAQAEEEEEPRSDETHPADGHDAVELGGRENREAVGRQHPERRARGHERRRGVAGAQRHRGQLRLVAHLGEEEYHAGRGERPPAGMLPGLVGRVGHERPETKADERKPEKYGKSRRRRSEEHT